MIKPIIGPTGSINTAATPAQSEAVPLENVQATKPFGTLSGINWGPIEQAAVQDVFFSDQSFRAQMFRYFKTLPNSQWQETQWMVSYTRSSGPSIWDKLAQPGKVALVVTPLFDENFEAQATDENLIKAIENKDENQENQQEQEKERDQNQSEDQTPEAQTEEIITNEISLENAGNMLFEELIRQAAGNNPFGHTALLTEPVIAMSVAESAFVKPMTNEVITTPTADSKSPNKVLLQHVYGHFLESHHYFQLGEAYERLKELPDQCLWVHLGEDKMHILGQEPPEAYGFKKVYNDTLANITNFIAPLANQYFDWVYDKDFLYLPNGGMVSLRPHAWQDKQSNRASLFQVKRLPNGTWFKVASIRNQATMSMRDLSEVKKTLENWNGRIEQQGWLREQTAKKSSL